MKVKNLVSLCSAAALTLGCCFAVGCDSDQTTPAADATVTEAEWANALRSIKEADQIGVSIVYDRTGELNTSATVYIGTRTTVRQDGYNRYYSFAYTNSAHDRSGYTIFDETSLIATQYYVAEGTTNWSRDMRTFTSVEEYTTSTADTGVAYWLNTYATIRASEDGQDTTLADLYSHFAYNAGEGCYSATVYYSTGINISTGKKTYSAKHMGLYFEDGVLVKQMTATESNGLSTVATATITYGETVSVPQSVLDADYDDAE